jgi:hypothetical protein
MLSLNPSTDSTGEPSNLNTAGLWAQHQSLRNRLLSQLEDLYAWRWRWQAANHGVVSTSLHNATQGPSPGISAIPNSSRAAEVPAQLLFTHGEAAAEITLYNAILIWLLALVWKLEPICGAELIQHCAKNAMLRETGSSQVDSTGSAGGSASPARRFDPLQGPGAALGIREPAMEICRVFEWQSRTHGAAATRGPDALYLFPMGTAMSVFEEDPDSMVWARSMLARSRVTSGYGAQQGGRPGSRGESSPMGEAARDGQRTSQATGFGFYVTKQALHPNSVSAHQEYTTELKRWAETQG